jgi:hypothetical protein
MSSFSYINLFLRILNIVYKCTFILGHNYSINYINTINFSKTYVIINNELRDFRLLKYHLDFSFLQLHFSLLT